MDGDSHLRHSRLPMSFICCCHVTLGLGMIYVVFSFLLVVVSVWAVDKGFDAGLRFGIFVVVHHI